jgi:deoxyribodipyrimidine photo-lyase
MTTHIVWFRHDLRVTDNMALAQACADPHAQVIAVYIATPEQWQKHSLSPRQAELMYAALLELQQSLATRSIPLHYHQSTTFKAAAIWLVDYCQTQRAAKLFFNRQYEINERQRDHWVEQQLSGRIECHGFDDSLLLPPGSIRTKSGDMYQIFTPFRRTCVQHLSATESRSLPAPAARGEALTASPSDLTPFDYPQQTQTLFAPINQEVFN